MTILASFLLAVTASTQTFHVTAVRDWTPADPAPTSRAFKIIVITGTMDGMRYTTQELLSWGTQRAEVGGDYEVLKLDSHAVTVRMHDKKGRDTDGRFDIVGVEELPK